MSKLAPLSLFAALALSACGGGGSGGAVGGTLPGCAQAGEPVQLPGALARLPLPEGSVIDHTRKDVAGNTIYGGYVPGDVKGAKEYFERELPKAGYDVGEGDSEDHEADLEFDGHGAQARLKVHDIDNCPNALTLEVATS